MQIIDLSQDDSDQQQLPVSSGALRNALNPPAADVGIVRQSQQTVSHRFHKQHSVQ